MYNIVYYDTKGSSYCRAAWLCSLQVECGVVDTIFRALSELRDLAVDIVQLVRIYTYVIYVSTS